MGNGSDQRAGLVFGFAAYGLWGFLPLYWHLLESLPPTEVLAHRDYETAHW